MKTIGREIGNVARKHFATSSGTVSSGKPIVVKDDGTVSEISETAAALGTEVAHNSITSAFHTTVFDSSNNKHIIVYRTSSNMRYVVATVASGGGVSFGTDAVVLSGDHQKQASTFDSTNNRIVSVFTNGNDSSHGYAMVGSLSGTTVTWGSATEFNNAGNSEIGIGFDSTAGKVVIVYRNGGNSNYGTAIVGTVSGTSISFGTPVVFNSGTTNKPRCVHDSTNNKMVVSFADGDDAAGKGDAVVGTISGTAISFGSSVRFEAGAISHSGIAFDSDTGKVVIAYRQNHETDGATDFKRGTAVVGTVSGDTISFGSAVAFDNTGDYGETGHGNVVYDTNAKKVIVVYPRTVSGSYSNRGYVFPLKVSGTTVVADTPTEFSSTASVGYPAVSFDSNVNKSLIAFNDTGNSEYGTAISFSPLIRNLTSENFLGFMSGQASFRSLAAATGSETVFEEAAVKMVSATYDSNSEKVVIAYKDEGNSNQGTAIVGTVSGTSISFGTPAVFETGAVFDIAAAFDTSNNKVVIAYRDNGNSDYGTAVVGTVSGTNISFGTPVVFESAYAEQEDIVFDSSNNRIVIVFRDAGNSDKGTAIVGNVSGTSISFGTAVIFEDAVVRSPVAAFDSTNNKVVVAYEDSGNSDNGTAIVGTVDPSDNSISFGTAVEWESASTGSTQIAIAYDTTNNKVVISYPNAADSRHGYSIVGEVDGTSISFGTAVEFEGGSLNGAYINSIYNEAAGKVIVFYYDIDDSNKKKYVEGTVSGSSISFGSPVEVDASNTTPSHLGIAYISNLGAEGVVLGYEDDGNSSYGTSLVFQTAYTNKATRDQIATSNSVSVDVKGAVIDNQVALTAGQQYFVQNDGTISETADDPSVFAGTAISATELIVKG